MEINGFETMPTRTLLAGVAANPRIAALDAKKDSTWASFVIEYLNVPVFIGVYAAGDAPILRSTFVFQ